MIYALVHYPAVDTRYIDELRRRYDPQAYLIAPHITVVFPLPDSVGEADLVSHIGNVLHDWERFPIHLQGLERSWDNYLFLLLQEGKAETIRLHDELYSGLLAPHYRRDILYMLHLTLGSFGGDAERCAQALREAEQYMLEYRCVVDRLHLVKVNEERTSIVWSKEFLLPK